MILTAIGVDFVFQKPLPVVSIPIRVNTPIKQFNPLHSNAIVRIELSDGSSCSGVIVSDTVVLSAAHCYLEAGGKIYDRKARLLADVIPYKRDKSGDVMSFIGDFSKLRHLPVNNRELAFDNPLKTFKTCGYPHGVKEMYCGSFIPQYNYYFQYHGKGLVIPGMSGGPVVDMETGEVVGINSTVSPDGGMNVGTMIGVQHLFE